jgi:hypothetical protein
MGDLSRWTSGWSDCNERTSVEQSLNIRIPTGLDTNVSSWDRGGNSDGGFGWDRVKSDF